MAGLRQLGQNMLLTKDDGTTITKVIKDKEEREQIKKDFAEKGVESILHIFEAVKEKEKAVLVEKPVQKPVEKSKPSTSGSYSGNER